MNSPLLSHAPLDFSSLWPVLDFPVVSRSARHRCRKQVYATKRDALTARNAAFLRRRNRPDQLRAYPCWRCHGWHLTHLPDPDETV